MRVKDLDTSHFTDAQYMTAQQKRRVLGDWVRFFAGGMRSEQFTKRLYEHLIQHCSYIAHYSRRGFFETYFADPEALQRFLDQFDRSWEALRVRSLGAPAPSRAGQPRRSSRAQAPVATRAEARAAPRAVAATGAAAKGSRHGPRSVMAPLSRRGSVYDRGGHLRDLESRRPPEEAISVPSTRTRRPLPSP